MVLSMFMKILNNDLLLSLKRCRDIRIGISSLYKIECLKWINEDFMKSLMVIVIVFRWYLILRRLSNIGMVFGEKKLYMRRK